MHGLGGVKSPTAAVTLAKYSGRILSSFDEARWVLYGVVFPATCADWKKIKNLRKMRLKTLDFTQNRDIMDLYPVRVCAEVYENKI